MRTLLQRTADGSYYQWPGLWTKNPDYAFDFEKEAEAIQCWFQQHAPPAQVVLEFEDSTFVVCKPCSEALLRRDERAPAASS